MSEGNVEMVRRCFALWGEGDFDALTGLTHPDFEFDLTRNQINPGLYRGPDGFRRFVEDVHEVWGELQIEPLELIDRGGKVVSCVRMSGTGLGSGAAAEMTVFQIWTFADEKVLRIVGGFRDRDQVLSAAEVSE